MFGFLNVYKPSGMTSFDVVSVLRKITGIKQIGHAGTLDPFATGVLPVCIGKSTRLIEYLPDDKEYIATIKFGSDTDTYDLEGQIIKTYNKMVTEDEFNLVLKDFDGEIEQVPPKYSAIKVNGKKLYDYARNGEEISIKPRLVKIYKAKLLDFCYQNQAAKILISCSKGTYIRSIAYDIGQKLNCGGHLIALERTKAGMFAMDKAVKLEDIKYLSDIRNNLINPIDVLPQEKYELNEDEKDRVIHGMPVKYSNNSSTVQLSSHSAKDIVFLLYSGRIMAVGIRNDNEIKIKKVFEVL